MLLHLTLFLKIYCLVLSWNPLWLAQIFLIVYPHFSCITIYIYIFFFKFFNDLKTYRIFFYKYKFIVGFHVKWLQCRCKYIVFFVYTLSAEISASPVRRISYTLLPDLAIKFPNHIHHFFLTEKGIIRMLFLYIFCCFLVFIVFFLYYC